MADIVLYNHETGKNELVPVEQANDLVKSGKYSSGGPIETTAGLTRNSGELEALQSRGEVEDVGAMAQTFTDQQQAIQDDLIAKDSEGGAHRFLAFADGVTDMLSLGLVDRAGKHDPLLNYLAGDMADQGGPDIMSDESFEARGSNYSGTKATGQVLGTVVGMGTPGLVSGTAKLGRKGAEAITKSLLKGPIGSRVAKEAGEGAALGFAHGFGSQVDDVLFDDKPFAAEAMLNEGGMGALLGAGIGFLGGAAGKVAGKARAEKAAALERGNRQQVIASSGLLDVESALSKEIHASIKSATKSFDEALEHHEMRAGVLDALAKEGHIPKEWVPELTAAIAATKRAQLKFGALDLDSALGAGIGKQSDEWLKAMEDYQDKLVKLDDLAIRTADTARKWNMMPKVKLGQAVEGPAVGSVARGERPVANLRELDSAVIGKSDNIFEPEYHPSTQAALLQAKNADAYAVAQGRPVPGAQPQGALRPTPQRQSVAGEMDWMMTPEGPNHLGSKVEVDMDSPPPRRAMTEEISTDKRTGGVSPGARNRGARKAVDQGPKPAPESSAKQSQKAIDQYLAAWTESTMQKAPRASAGDVSAAKVGELMDKISQLTNGRLDSTAAVDLFKTMGYKPAQSVLGSQIQQLLTARTLGRAVADGSRGIKNPAGEAGRKTMLSWLGRRMAGSVGAKAGRKVLGGAVGGMLGGPLGAILGAKFVDDILGTAGKGASAVGRINMRIAKTVEKVLAGNRGAGAGLAIRAISGNKPVAYSEGDPIEEPTERIQQIKQMAQNPDAIAHLVQKQMGDKALLHSDIAKEQVKLIQNRMIKLSMKAPAMYWDRMGNLIPPNAQEMRRFHLYENATNDLMGALEAMESGYAPDEVYEAVRDNHPGAHAKLVQGILSNPDVLKKASRSTLKQLERITGLPITKLNDPMFLSRQRMAWGLHDTMKGMPPSNAVNAPLNTPAQAQMAPGNQ